MTKPEGHRVIRIRIVAQPRKKVVAVAEGVLEVEITLQLIIAALQGELSSHLIPIVNPQAMTIRVPFRGQCPLRFVHAAQIRRDIDDAARRTAAIDDRTAARDDLDLLDLLHRHIVIVVRQRMRHHRRHRRTIDQYLYIAVCLTGSLSANVDLSPERCADTDARLILEHVGDGLVSLLLNGAFRDDDHLLCIAQLLDLYIVGTDVGIRELDRRRGRCGFLYTFRRLIVLFLCRKRDARSAPNDQGATHKQTQIKILTLRDLASFHHILHFS